MQWYEGMTKGWSVDSVLDVVVPAAAGLTDEQLDHLFQEAAEIR